MVTTELGRIGKRGTWVIPARLRKRFGITEGSYVVCEEREEGILIRPAAVLPYENYTPERVAEFLLSSAVDAADYANCLEEVRQMGLDPANIRHHKPRGV